MTRSGQQVTDAGCLKDGGDGIMHIYSMEESTRMMIAMN